MSEEKGAELFRALHANINAITNLNLRHLKAEAKASSSSAEEGTSTKAFAKGKAKDPHLDWTKDFPYNPVPITPFSIRPRFSQVVESSLESPIVSPSRVALEAASLANYSPAVLDAWTAMNPPVRRGQDAQNQGGQRDGQGGPQGVNGDGNGGGGNGNGQDGGGQPPLAYQTAAEFLAA
jgi:hypothetical protein